MPIFIRSIDRMGVISQAVPQKNASSAATNSERSMSLSMGFIAYLSYINLRTLSRVTLSRISLEIDGVIGIPSRIMNRHMPGPSDTLPREFKKMAVS